MKCVEQNISIIDDKQFYKTIKKYLYNNNVIVHYIYNENDIIDDTYLKNNKCDLELSFKIRSIHAINIKDTKKRYSYIYDIVCEYLDNEFRNKNICDFCDSKCKSVRASSYFEESKSGCCYGRKRGICKYLTKKGCSITCITCKLFTCKYLTKQGIKFNINDIPLLKYFFNYSQKNILLTSFFTEKEEILNLLIKNKKRLF